VSDSINHVHSNFGGECSRQDLSPYVVLPTDASHVEMLVKNWQNAKKITHHYEFLIYTGEYNGVRLSACSVGLSGVPTATAIEELSRLGAHTFMHVGFADPVIGEMKMGELVISTGAVRMDGTSLGYVRPEFPSLAHFENVMATISSAQNRGLSYQVATVCSFASYDLLRANRTINPEIQRSLDELANAGVYGGTGVEAVIFVQSALYGLRAGSISVSPIDQETQSVNPSVIENALLTSADAITLLAKWDCEKSRTNKPYILP